jgi:hypothetical protein
MSGIAAIGALAVIVGTATTVLIAELIERCRRRVMTVAAGAPTPPAR